MISFSTRSKISGRISPLLAPRVYRAAWLPDSQGLVLARKKTAKNLAEIAAALGPERTRALAAKAEAAWLQLKDLPRSDEFDKRAAEVCGADLEGIVAYLREQPAHLAALRVKFAADWKKEDETKPIDLSEVVIARLSGAKLARAVPVTPRARARGCAQWWPVRTATPSWLSSVPTS